MTVRIDTTANIEAVRLKEAAAPDTPASGYGKLYAKTDGKVYFKNDAGTETDLTASGGAGSDTTAIHDDTNSEISAITAKTTPVSGDYLLIEDSAASNAKKSVTVGNLLSQTSLLGLTAGINFIIDGGGSAITTGVKGYIEIPFACTINQVTMLADQSGSIVVDIWKDTYANHPPTDADSITASAVPTITTATKSQDATLTGWTTSIAAGDILGFNVDSATTVTLVTVALKVTRT